MSANEKQVGGNHYKDQKIEPWDYITANKIGYLEGNVIKYISRWKQKNGLQDLEKAKHYLEKLIEVNSRNSKSVRPRPWCRIALFEFGPEMIVGERTEIEAPKWDNFVKWLTDRIEYDN